MTNFGSTGVLKCFEDIKNIDDFNKDNEHFLRFHYNILSNVLSYKYYTENGYRLEKRLYKKDEYSFASWESNSLNKIIKTVERGLLSIYKDLREIPFYEAENGREPNELGQLNPNRDKSLIKLILIFMDLIKTQEFLEDIIKQTRPNGDNIWGDNERALFELYNETKNNFFEDNGLSEFYKVFLDNYNGIYQSNLKMIGHTLPNYGYLLYKLKPFFELKYQNDYAQWISSNILLNDKKYTKKRIKEMLKMHQDEPIKNKKEIDIISNKVENWHRDIILAKNTSSKFNTTL